MHSEKGKNGRLDETLTKNGKNLRPFEKSTGRRIASRLWASASAIIFG